MKLATAERPTNPDSISEHWKVRDKLEVRIAELERIVANQADIIHMLVQSTTMLMKVANGAS